jgi:peroxiredoxin Q/BCP
VSDPDETLCQAFGVIKLKNMYGRQVLGIERSTFLIDPQGRLAQVWRGVRVPGHAEAVYEALKQAHAAT